MIVFAYLKGTLAGKTADSIVLDVNGIGFRVYATTTTLMNCRDPGSAIKLFTHFYVREDTQALYGFLTEEELSLVSNIPPSQFGLAVLTDDAGKFTKAPGIGKKTAQRIILELKDKLKKEQAQMPQLNPEPAGGASQDNRINEAINALVMLGYSSQEASEAVSHSFSNEKSVEQIIRDALKQMLH